MEDHLPISFLRPDLMSKFNLVGVIISAERPRLAPTKFGRCCSKLIPQVKQCVFNILFDQQPHQGQNDTFSTSQFATKTVIQSTVVVGAL